MRIFDDIYLKKIVLSDHPQLLKLMLDIYPPVYNHLWQDNGEYYINDTYNFNNFSKELKISNTLYCFILFRSKIVGILRVLDNEPIPDFVNISASKLQRLYLSPDSQRKGIGGKVIQWVGKRVLNMGNSILWLETMDTQNMAIKFYKKCGFKISGEFDMKAKLLKSQYKGMFRMCKNVREVK